MDIDKCMSMGLMVIYNISGQPIRKIYKFTYDTFNKQIITYYSIFLSTLLCFISSLIIFLLLLSPHLIFKNIQVYMRYFQ